MGSDLLKRVGQRVRKLRTLAGLTQADLAESANLSPEFVSRVERGVKAPSLVILDRVARALGVTLAELLTFGPPEADRKQAALAGLVSFLAPLNVSEIRLMHDVGKVILKHRQSEHPVHPSWTDSGRRIGSSRKKGKNPG